MYEHFPRSQLVDNYEESSFSYSPSGSASTDIQRLNEAAKSSTGYLGRNLARAGSEANVLQTQRGNLENQQTFDPWGYYRPAAAEALAGQVSQGNPTDVWRNKLTNMMEGEFTPDDPSYKFRFQQGQQATERSLATKGLLNSGNAALALQEHGQQAASQEYGNQFERVLKGMMGVESQYNSQQGRLMELAGVNIGPSVLSNHMLGASSQASENNYRSAVDRGIASTENTNPYAGYRFG